MNLSEMKNDKDPVQSLFRYVAHLENRVNELERREKATRPYFQKLFSKVRMARRVAEGFPRLTPRQEKASEQRGKNREQLRKWREVRDSVKKRHELIEVNEGRQPLAVNLQISTTT